MRKGGQSIAIIGAGFAGVALAQKLSFTGNSVTIFDPLGIGGMSARIPIVLCHPYPSRMCVRTMYASKALQRARHLITLSQAALNKQVAFFTGLERLNSIPKVMHEDLKVCNNAVLITSGYSLNVKDYLDGLFLSCKNVKLEKKEISSLEELKGFEKIVLCIGGVQSKLSGLLDFLKLDRIKGQILLCKKKHNLRMPRMDTLHEIPMGQDLLLGSTYEREFQNLEPNIKEALIGLKKRKGGYPFEKLVVKRCYASSRLSRKSPQYLPVCEHIRNNLFAFTALGSRGALYHALFAEKMANLITEI